MRIIRLSFAAAVAAALSFACSADTWLWIGESPNTYKDGTVGLNLGTARDWRDGYNWTNLTRNVRGTLYPDNTTRPQDGDTIIFDGDVKHEYTHCFGAHNSGSYAAVIVLNSFSNSYGSHVPIKNGGLVCFATANDVGNQSFQCPNGSFEFAVSNKTVASHFNNGVNTIRKTGAGTLKLITDIKTYRTACLRLEGGTLAMGTSSNTNSGPALCSMRDQLVLAGNNVTIDLTGLNQNLTAALVEEPGISGHKITSTAAACLTLAGNADDFTFTGKVGGKASVCWNPSDDTKTLTFAGGECATEGTLIASNGVVAIAAGTTFAKASFAVFGTGRLQFPSGQLVILPSGTVKVEGDAIADGAYTGSGVRGKSVSWLAGDAFVAVGDGAETGETVEKTWNGTGTLSTLANWQGETTLPTLGEGNVKMTVAGGASATVDADYWIRGIAVGADVTTFGFDGTSLLWLGSLGFTTPGVGGTYALSAPIGLAAGQCWTVGAGDTLKVEAPLSTVVQAPLTFNGAGTVSLEASSPDLTSPVSIANGKVVVKADGALGKGETTVETSSAVLDLQARRYDGAITIDSAKTGAASLWKTDRDQEFNGKFTVKAGDVKLSPAKGKTWTFAGGLETGPNVTHTFGGAGVVVITNKPYLCGSSTRVNFMGCDVHLWVDGNDINSSQQGWIGGGATVYTHVTNALGWANMNIAGGQDSGIGTLDLCGCDQLIVNIQCGRGGKGNTSWITGKTPGYIRSDLPALLRVKDDSFSIRPSGNSTPSSTNWAYFVGQAGFSKEGGYRGHWLNQESSSSGTVQVVKGKLYFSKSFVDGNGNDYGTGSWPNAAKAVAKGTGTLVFEHRKAIGKNTVVEIADTGKVEIGEGVVQRCAALVTNGVAAKAVGSYGSSQSAAEFKDDIHFAGKGILKVGKSGMMVVVR